MPKKSTKIIGYKGFDKDLKCKKKQYEVGKKTTQRGTIELCGNGLHFVENPLDVLNYYPLRDGNRYAVVEAEGVTDQTDGDSKRVARSLTLQAEINVKGIIDAGVKFIFDKAEVTESGNATSGNDAHSATSGNDAHSATSGNRANSATSGYGAHSATSGNRANSATSGYGAHSATSGEYAHSATSGNRAHSATSGYGAHSATSGNDAHSATSGYGAHSATSGYGAHSATSGDDSNSATSGRFSNSATSGLRSNSATSGYGSNSATDSSTGIACAIGQNSKVKGAINSIIVLAEWAGTDLVDAYPLWVKSAKVDGKTIKADQWYKLVDGEFVETGDSNS